MTFVLLVSLFGYLLSFAYFILVLLPNVNLNLKISKVSPWIG